MNAREKKLVWLAGIMLSVFVIWLAAWRPLTQQRQTLSSSVTQLNDDLPWMRAAAAEIQRLGDAAQPVSRGGQSLLALAESSARGAGLGQSWRRAEPGAGGELRVWLENAPFDAMLRWLIVLQKRYSVSVAEASIDQAGIAGVVNVRLLLAEPLGE
ncbi:MAG: type II secretion system protein M [Pseudomonadota bacterium]